jgi:hypothetical protein
MDSFSSQEPVVFSYRNLLHEGSALVEPWEVYLQIVADFEVSVMGRIIYSEKLFPVVEFAVQSQAWLINVAQNAQDFVFSSMESEDQGLVWIKACDSEWLVGSVFEEAEPSSPVQLIAIQSALDNFYMSLRSDVRARFQADIASLFAWKGIQAPNHLTQ